MKLLLTLARYLLFILATLILLALSYLVFIAFQTGKPDEYPAGLATIGGVVAALTSVAFSFGQSNEKGLRKYIDREAGTLLTASIYWFLSAATTYIFTSSSLPTFIGVNLSAIWGGLVGVLIILATLCTVAPLLFIVGAVQEPDEVLKSEQIRATRPKRFIDKMLNR